MCAAVEPANGCDRTENSVVDFVMVLIILARSCPIDLCTCDVVVPVKVAVKWSEKEGAVSDAGVHCDVLLGSWTRRGLMAEMVDAVVSTLRTDRVP